MANLQRLHMPTKPPPHPSRVPAAWLNAPIAWGVVCLFPSCRGAVYLFKQIFRIFHDSRDMQILQVNVQSKKKSISIYYFHPYPKKKCHTAPQPSHAPWRQMACKASNLLHCNCPTSGWNSTLGWQKHRWTTVWSIALFKGMWEKAPRCVKGCHKLLHGFVICVILWIYMGNWVTGYAYNHTNIIHIRFK